MAGHGMGPRGFLTEEEKSNKPKITKVLIKRILGYLKPYVFQFIMVFVTIILSATVGLLPSIITGKIVDQPWWARTCVFWCSCSSWPLQP